MTVIATIVEGHGEQQAVQRLLRRIATDAAPRAPLRANVPIRVKSGSFFNDTGYFSRYVNLAAAKVRQEVAGHVLILLDCEDEAPPASGPGCSIRLAPSHPT